MEALATQITDYLWSQSRQIAVLTVVIGVFSFLLRNKSAHVRYLLWLVVVGKCLVPPLVTIPLAVLPEATVVEAVDVIAAGNRAAVFDGVPAARVHVETGAPAPVVEGPSIVERLGRVSAREWAAVGWLGGAIVFGAAALGKAVRVNRRVKRRRKGLTAEMEGEVGELFCRIGVRKAPSVWFLEGVGQPFVWGLLRGSIYLPGGFGKTESAESRRGILGHELSHVLRFDAGVNVLQIAAQVIFWFHPFVWWANRRIRAEREKCCDETAIARLGTKARDYSTAIVNTLIAERESWQAAPSLAIAGPIKTIEDRIRTIMAPGKKFYRRAGVFASIAIGLLALVAAPTTLGVARRGGDRVRGGDSGRGEFAVKLANGVTVELKGVCEHPSEGGQWWRPDGSPARVMHYENVSGKLNCSADGKAYEFAVAFKDMAEDGAGVIRTEPQGSSIGGSLFSAVYKDGERVKNMGFLGTCLEKKLESCVVRIDVAAGEWRTLIEHGGIGGSSSYGTADGGVAFSQIFEEGGRSLITITHSLTKQCDKRVVAVDEYGDLHKAVSTNTAGAGEFDQLTAAYKLGKNHISKFLFQIRPYETVRFNGVSLKRGFKTDVTVEAGPEDAGEGEKVVERREGQGFVTLVLDVEGVTFRGRRLKGLEELPELLALAPEREKTVLQVVASRRFKIQGDWEFIKDLLAAWSREYGFAGVEYVGEEAAGGKGAARPARRGSATPVEGEGREGERKKREIYLGDVDFSKKLLDLGSGGLVGAPFSGGGPEETLAAVERMGRGDLFYEHGCLAFVRGAQADKYETIDADGVSLNVYRIGESFPQVVGVTTKEGRKYRLEIVSANDDGCRLRVLPAEQAAGRRSAAGKPPAAMIGTWFFENPDGDDEQMAVFGDGKVIVLYSNGHKDQTYYDGGFIELAEYDNARSRLSMGEGGKLLQKGEVSEAQSSIQIEVTKKWKRIDDEPQTELLRPLTGAGVKASTGRSGGERRWRRRLRGEEGQAIAEVLTSWFEGCSGGDIELVTSAWAADKVGNAERNCAEMQELLVLNPGWEFSLVSVLWHEDAGMAVSGSLEHGDRKVGGGAALVWRLKRYDGDWRVVDIYLEEPGGLVREKSRFLRDHPGAKVWFDEAGPKSGRGGYGAPGLIGALRKSRRMAGRAESGKRVAELGRALIMFANDNEGRYPGNLKGLKGYVDEEGLRWLLENVEYSAAGKTTAGAPGLVLAYDRRLLAEGEGTNVLFNDGHVEFAEGGRLEELGIEGQIKRKISIEARFVSVAADANEIDEFLDENKFKVGAEPNSIHCLLDSAQSEELLELVRVDAGSRTLTAPRVVVFDGEEAEISVGEEMHYTSGYREPNRPQAAPEPIYDSVTKGTVFKIRPRLQAESNILVSVEARITNLLGFEKRFYRERFEYQIPEQEVVSIESKAVVPGGKTLVIAGIKVTEQDEDTDRRVVKDLLVMIKAERVAD